MYNVKCYIPLFFVLKPGVNKVKDATRNGENCEKESVEKESEK